MKIGAQLYTIRDFCKVPHDIESSLRRIKAMGFNLIQISSFGPCDVDLLAGWIKELEMEVCVTHNSWGRLTEPAELKKLIDENKKLGCSHIGLGMKPGIFPDSYHGYTGFIRKANEICKQVQDEGLSFGYHNHEIEFQKFGGVRAIDRMMAECPDLYFILDLFWVQAGGASPAAYVEKMKGRIKVLHLKDYRVIGQTRQFAEIGEGNLDWDDIIPRGEKNGIPYAVIEQDSDFLVDPFESLALSRKFLMDKGYWK
ncbi:MAG: sugar phosphate isomerase/epimerase [Treponema sp.]|jgi:sugar phosphate isomerase/epimerase|nr:sugar phosphate isomerase/epimerase [Treponema sp.]